MKNTEHSKLAAMWHWLIGLVRFFGLPGSWKWACRQMAAGKILHPSTAAGCVEYKLSSDGQRRLMWRFGGDWENAHFFLRDQEYVKWEIKSNAQGHRPDDDNT